jgi:hypothetical protein
VIKGNRLSLVQLCRLSRALDPAVPTTDVATARRETDGRAFQRDRLQVAVAKLGERLREVMLQEKNQRWLIA